VGSKTTCLCSIANPNPKKRTISPTIKWIAADSSLGQTQPLDERGETIELEVSFLNNDHQRPMASCVSGGNIFVINCNEDNVESILLRVDSILQGITQNILRIYHLLCY
jgi:hypothetical protein